MSKNERVYNDELSSARRTFLKSVASSGVLLALSTRGYGATTMPADVGEMFLPTVSDSLFLYADLVDEIRDAFLKVYVARVVKAGAAVRKAVQTLTELATQLEIEVPELRSGGS